MSLIDLIRHPHIWRGKENSSPGPVIATGFVELDRHLPGGGWPQGALTEIHLDRYGIGELRLLMPALASLSRCEPEEGWVVWIAPPFIPYAPALARYGVDVERMLLVHPTAEEQSLWATEQALRSASCIAVLGWIRSARQTDLRRLQLLAEAQGCWAVLFRPRQALREHSPAALRIHLVREHASTRAKIIKNRGGSPASIDLSFPPLPCWERKGDSEGHEW